MSSVNSIFFEALETCLAPDKVAMPNCKFDPGQLEKYYEVFIVPGVPRPLDFGTHNFENGFCQVSCFVKENVGEIKAVEMALKVIDAFPRNKKFEDTAFQISLIKPAYYSKGMYVNNGWYVVPVTIPYTVHNF